MGFEYKIGPDSPLPISAIKPRESKYNISNIHPFSSEEEGKKARDTLRGKIQQVNGLLPFPPIKVEHFGAGDTPQFYLTCYRPVENKMGCSDCTYNPDIHKLSGEELPKIERIVTELSEQFKQ